ncbi:hypothetical protein [Pararhizobium sp.]|uniref:hypothetical protein n=1 Tax=Pararhizobium sp. TaxID=1977563 RepID=UPI00271DB491|nr:hypothetical protein [Pararhizobium sp.]MDO9416993.1 hypothetical protein [Pararhizobium sp.]
MQSMKEIREACSALAAKVGAKAYVSLSVSNQYEVFASLYTKGITQNMGDASAFSLTANGSDDPFELLEKLEHLWVAESDKRGVRLIEEMALEIIRLTAEFGSCTDAALRAKYGENVAKHSSAAIAKANEMASNGPFSIEVMAGRNAA